MTRVPPPDLSSIPGPASALPSAFEALPDLVERGRDGGLALFLDYDGTLTPIVATPELAVLDDDAREVVQRLVARFPVAVVSGRGLDDLVEHVAIDGLTYAGSHGFEVQHPDGTRTTVPGAEAFLDALGRAGDLLEARLRPIPGARLERKRFALAAHFRLTPELRVVDVQEAVMDVAGQVPGLHIAGGKQVLELRPDMEWHKGHAVRALLRTSTAAGHDPCPVYLGDDQTDEDAFREIASDGLGIVVGEPALTSARMRLADVPEVVRWLDALVVASTD